MSALAQTVSWRRNVPDHDFMNRYSRRHVAMYNAERTLCGAQIRWMHYAPSDGGRCARCYRLAKARGLVDEYGEQIE